MHRNLLNVILDLLKGTAWNSNSPRGLPKTKNAVQAQGSKLEVYVKDLLCGVQKVNIADRKKLYDKFLAFQGDANNPPDAMFRGGNDGDAFEIKKIETTTKNTLALNSSFPYSHLRRDLSRLSNSAKKCETWSIRDIFYVIGNVEPARKLGNWLWFIQGKTFAQNLDFYLEIENELRSTINQALVTKGLRSSTTNELGRVNNIDSLKRTSLRIRGMWMVQNPIRIFSSIPSVNENPKSRLTIHFLLLKSKWLSLSKKIPNFDNLIKDYSEPKFSLNSVEVSDPEDAKSQLECKLARIEL